jgi:hypothetical protein
MSKASSSKIEQRKTLGKFFYDLSKLTFAALVLGALLTYFQSDELELSMSMGTMLISGAIATLVFAIFGNNLNR